jgi:type IV secretory pathway TrbD component
MASERAKQLAAEQKAMKKAEQLRRKNSTDPKDWGQVRQIIEVYKVTAEHDPKANLFMGGALVLCIVVFTVVGIFVKPWWLYVIFGVLFGVLAAMSVLTWRAKSATYKRYEGQKGSAEVAMSMLGKEWVKSPVITANRQLDIVHRVVGPGGIVLIGEGDPGRVRAMLATEAKKHEQVKYGVKVTTLVMGDRENQVPLGKLADHIKKLPKIIKTAEITDISNRLRALDSMRPKLPLPKGPMPTSAKGSRAAVRGR